jgi:molybdopterin/thiamine biosynthesis adenylyltransferase
MLMSLPEATTVSATAPPPQRVVIVGLGGLGCAVAEILAASTSPTVQLDLYDDDVVDPGNLPRQLLYTQDDVDRYKADVALERLTAIVTARRLSNAGHADADGTRRESPSSGPALTAHVDRLDAPKARAAFAGAALVVDCTDAAVSKWVVHDAARAAGVDLVHGAAVAFDGRLGWFPFERGRAGCLHCLYPLGGGPRPGERGCAQLGVLGPWVGHIAARQVLAALDAQPSAHAGYGPLAYPFLQTFDGRTFRARTLFIDPDPDCPACGAPVATPLAELTAVPTAAPISLVEPSPAARAALRPLTPNERERFAATIRLVGVGEAGQAAFCSATFATGERPAGPLGEAAQAVAARYLLAAGFSQVAGHATVTLGALAAAAPVAPALTLGDAWVAGTEIAHRALLSVLALTSTTD